MGRKVSGSNSRSTIGRKSTSSSSLASFLTLEFNPPKEKPKPIPLTLAQKWSKLLYNEEFSDICIRLDSDSESKNQKDGQDNEIVCPCHKLVLASQSPFFWRLFKTSEDLNVIRFIEFSPESIRIFLKYLYTEELDPGIWEPRGEVLLHILELSSKFEVPSLKCACIENLNKLELTAANALQIWVRAREYQEVELEEFTIKYICINAEQILSSSSQTFLELHTRDLKALIKRDDLQIEEFALFTVAVNWAKYKCESRSLPASGPMIRRMLRDSIYLIRFPLMTTSLFTNIIIPMGILSADEVAKILRLMYLPSQYDSDDQSNHSLLGNKPSSSYFDGNNNSSNNHHHNVDAPQFQFNKKPRLKKGPLFTVSRFGPMGSDEKFFGDKFYSFRFIASRSIALVGFFFYGPGSWTLKNSKMTDKLIFDIEVHLRKFDGSLFTFAIASKSFVVTREKWEKCQECHRKLPVNFDFPVTIQPNSWYHLQYRINGPPTASAHLASRKSKTVLDCRQHGEITFQFLPFPENLDENQLPELIFKFF